MRHHIKKGERLFVVPDYQVQEPIPWDEIPAVIDRAHKHVLSQIAPENKCGGCAECCKIPYLKTQTFEKPSHTACQNCSGNGCAIYWNRPLQCETFQCLWLKSQSTEAPMPLELRPDHARVILTGPELPEESEDQIYIHPQGKIPRGSQSCSMSEPMADWLSKCNRPQMIITHYTGETVK